MKLKMKCLLLIAVMFSALNVIAAEQPQNQESTAEAAARKQAELAKLPRITAEELKAKLSRNEAVFILDVRMPDDYDNAKQKIKGSVRISPYDLKTRMNEIPKDRDVITFCTCPEDHTSARVAQILMQNGYVRVRVLKDGWNAWVDAGGELEPRDAGDKKP